MAVVMLVAGLVCGHAIEETVRHGGHSASLSSSPAAVPLAGESLATDDRASGPSASAGVVDSRTAGSHAVDSHTVVSDTVVSGLLACALGVMLCGFGAIVLARRILAGGRRLTRVDRGVAPGPAALDAAIVVVRPAPSLVALSVNRT